MKLSKQKEFDAARVDLVEGHPDVAVITATKDYIHIDEFKDIFNYAGKIIKVNKIKKLVFDKRKLTKFHQPSMEWYFVDWKEEMAAHGLAHHRKILPEDDVFNFAVKAGKKMLQEKYPNAKCFTLDIQYSDSLEEAVTS